MTTRGVDRGAQLWRSRAFVQPLLVTVVGVAALPAALIAWRFLDPSPLSPYPTSDCTNECGTARFAAGLVNGLILLGVWCVLLLAVGFVAGWSSPDARVAFGAVLVGMVGLAFSVAVVTLSTTSESILDIVGIFLGVATVPLIPIALGFGVARMVRPRARKPSDRPAPG